MLKPNSKGIYTSAFVLACGISTIGLFTTRDQTGVLFLAYFSSFFTYFWLSQFDLSFKSALGLGLFIRLLLFFGMPTLSDDIFRFIWDGNLLANGISPFEQLPGYYLSTDSQISGLDMDLYETLNSPEYFSIYPPVNQALFWLSVKLGGSSWLFSANIIRTFLVLADVGSLLLLRRLLGQHGQRESLANWFWLNPLVILEFTGNVHFEGVVIFFLFGGIYLIKTKRWSYSGPAFGLAIATKLVPLVLLPAIFFKNWFKKGFIISLIAVFVAILSFIPLFDLKLIEGISASMGLYFKKFEFNASLYFILREIGFWVKGYNTIGTLGPYMGLLSFLSVITLSIFGNQKDWSLEKTLLFCLSAYLMLSTTVHPWYILPLIPLGLLAGYYYPVCWSFLIFVTYFGYDAEGFKLSPYWIVLEYVLLIGFFVIENIRKAHEMSMMLNPKHRETSTGHGQN